MILQRGPRGKDGAKTQSLCRSGQKLNGRELLGSISGFNMELIIAATVRARTLPCRKRTHNVHAAVVHHQYSSRGFNSLRALNGLAKQMPLLKARMSGIKAGFEMTFRD